MEPVFDATPATLFENFSGTKQQKCSSSEYQVFEDLKFRTFYIFSGFCLVRKLVCDFTPETVFNRSRHRAHFGLSPKFSQTSAREPPVRSGSGPLEFFEFFWNSEDDFGVWSYGVFACLNVSLHMTENLGSRKNLDGLKSDTIRSEFLWPLKFFSRI